MDGQKKEVSRGFHLKTGGNSQGKRAKGRKNRPQLPEPPIEHPKGGDQNPEALRQEGKTCHQQSTTSKSPT